MRKHLVSLGLVCIMSMTYIFPSFANMINSNPVRVCLLYTSHTCFRRNRFFWNRNLSISRDVYKRQSTDSIMREVMACYCAKPVEPALTVIGNAGSIIGIYSPVNRCLKTSFALTMGQLMARDRKTLYVNLEDCSGLRCV